LFHGVECLSVGGEIKALDFGEIGECQFLEDISWLYGELDWSCVMRAQNLKNLLEADAVAIDDRIIFELIYKLFLFGGVLQLMQRQFHVDFEQVRKRLKYD